MPTDWGLSDDAISIVREGMAQYVNAAGKPDFAYCPMIMWSLGGEMVLADGARNAVPPRYELGIAKIADVSARKFITVEDARLGLIAFSPRDIDLMSDRRLIDYNGIEIVVR